MANQITPQWRNDSLELSIWQRQWHHRDRHTLIGIYCCLQATMISFGDVIHSDTFTSMVATLTLGAPHNDTGRGNATAAATLRSRSLLCGGSLFVICKSMIASLLPSHQFDLILTLIDHLWYLFRSISSPWHYGAATDTATATTVQRYGASSIDCYCFPYWLLLINGTIASLDSISSIWIDSITHTPL